MEEIPIQEALGLSRPLCITPLPLPAVMLQSFCPKHRVGANQRRWRRRWQRLWAQLPGMQLHILELLTRRADFFHQTKRYSWKKKTSFQDTWSLMASLPKTFFFSQPTGLSNIKNHICLSILHTHRALKVISIKENLWHQKTEVIPLTDRSGWYMCLGSGQFLLWTTDGPP